MSQLQFTGKDLTSDFGLQNRIGWLKLFETLYD